MDLDHPYIKCGSKTVVGPVDCNVHLNRMAKGEYALGSLWGVGCIVVHITTTNVGMERSFVFGFMVSIDSNCYVGYMAL